MLLVGKASPFLLGFLWQHCYYKGDVEQNGSSSGMAFFLGMSESVKLSGQACLGSWRRWANLGQLNLTPEKAAENTRFGDEQVV